MCSKDYVCILMYKCRKITQRCLHVGNVCDGNKDCPYGDDELFCDFKNVKCPSKCICLFQAISCINAPYLIIDTEISLLYLSVYISHSNVYFLNELHDTLKNVIIAKFPRNCLIEICQAEALKKVLLLDLGFNCFQIIYKNCFSSFHVLHTLSINDNYITNIETGSFYNLSYLKFLNLSNNPLENLPETVLKDSVELQVFYITNVTLMNIHTDALLGLSAEVILTTDYQLCCLSSDKSLCQTHKPWYFSCSDILPKKSMKVFFILIFTLIIFLNVLSILIHFPTRKSNDAFSVTVISININDIVCGIYLGCIWISDVIYKGEFLVQEKLWKSGHLCFTAFGIVLWFTILDQLILIFISLCRLMLVICPINTKFKESEFVLKSVVLCYLLSFLAALLVTYYFKLTYEHLTFSLCLPFIDPTGSVIMIKIIILYTVISQTISSVTIIIMHILLVKGLKEAKKNTGQSKSSFDSNTPLFLQLILITTSSILCWFPANGIYIAAMLLSTYPTDLIIWTTVAGLPINAIINPSVIIINSSRKKCIHHTT